jgi:hypothetical protein
VTSVEEEARLASNVMAPEVLLVREFFPRAAELRRALDDHFDDPLTHSPATHGIWDYWHVHGLYTYLRTLPERIIATELLEAFLSELRAWTRQTLGYAKVGHPYLSLYVDGCGQALHNDAENGAFGYVYSLTRWKGRRFDGGETIIMRTDDYWGSGRSRSAGAGTSFYRLIEPEFNRLVVFNDRLIHGVERIQGTMDPRQGRVVLHGHIRQ